jgi:hypothetical protein
VITVAGGHPRATGRLTAFFVGAVSAGGLAYGAVGQVGHALGLWKLPIGLPLFIASGLLLGAWYYWQRKRPSASQGRQISKRLARASGIGPIAYGAVLGVGLLTIVSTPAVWLGLVCCLGVGRAASGVVYGMSFGAGRAFVLVHDSHQVGRGAPEQIVLHVLGRQLDPKSYFPWYGILAGVTMVSLAAVASVLR